MKLRCCVCHAPWNISDYAWEKRDTEPNGWVHRHGTHARFKSEAIGATKPMSQWYVRYRLEGKELMTRHARELDARSHFDWLKSTATPLPIQGASLIEVHDSFEPQLASPSEPSSTTHQPETVEQSQ